jgi:cytochrome b
MGKVKIWDKPTRAFHWLIVLLVGTSWAMAELGWMKIHMWSGLTILTLVIFRILWGFFGSTTARFSNFITHPRVAVNYVRAVLRSEKRQYAGHNPAGGWVALGLMLLLMAQASTGLFSHDDINFKGPLAYMVDKGTSDLFSSLHHASFNLIIIGVAIHIAAVFFYMRVKGENLVLPMITGYKEEKQVPPGTRLHFVSSGYALLLLALSAALVWWIIR